MNGCIHHVNGPQVSELGRSYSELRAFRQLLFLSDQAEVPNVAALLNQTVSDALRPSTVMNHCFTRAPQTMSSPHDHLGISHRAYVEWLVVGVPLPTPCPPIAPPPMGLLQTIPPESGAAREACAWVAVQGSLDAYAQRCSARQESPEEVYSAMAEGGSVLVEKYLSHGHGSPPGNGKAGPPRR